MPPCARCSRCATASPVPEPEITVAGRSARSRARLAGRYRKGRRGYELTVSGDRLSILPLEGGEPARVRSLGDALMVDDRLAYGPRIVARDGALEIDGERFRRVRAPQAASRRRSGGAG